MKKYNLITPEGTRDLLFDECMARRGIEKELMGLFVKNNYHEVITPLLEFYDVFDNFFPQESVYKLTDAKGRLMVLRPDSTIPIIRRLAETRLHDEPRPLKLCYNQTIYRANPKEAGRDDEIAQSGIEIIGGSIKETDFEALTLALETLELISGNYRFEIGDCGIFNVLLQYEGIENEDEKEELRKLIESKNYPELSAKAPGLIAELPKLFGGAEVFEKAEKLFGGVPVEYNITRLKSIFDELNKVVNGNKINVDFGLTNKRGYYSEIFFNGYIEGYGKPILSGGRYLFEDTNGIGWNTLGVGFAVNVSAAANLRKG